MSTKYIILEDGYEIAVFENKDNVEEQIKLKIEQLKKVGYEKIKVVEQIENDVTSCFIAQKNEKLNVIDHGYDAGGGDIQNHIIKVLGNRVNTSHITTDEIEGEIIYKDHGFGRGGGNLMEHIKEMKTEELKIEYIYDGSIGMNLPPIDRVPIVEMPFEFEGKYNGSGGGMAMGEPVVASRDKIPTQILKVSSDGKKENVTREIKVGDKLVGRYEMNGTVSVIMPVEGEVESKTDIRLHPDGTMEVLESKE